MRQQQALPDTRNGFALLGSRELLGPLIGARKRTCQRLILGFEFFR